MENRTIPAGASKEEADAIFRRKYTCYVPGSVTEVTEIKYDWYGRFVHVEVRGMQFKIPATLMHYVEKGVYTSEIKQALGITEIVPVQRTTTNRMLSRRLGLGGLSRIKRKRLLAHKLHRWQ